MSYIDENLMSDEKLLYRTHPHWIIFNSAIGWAILALLILIIGPYSGASKWALGGGYRLYSVFSGLFLFIALINGFMAYIQYVASEYGITNKRVLIKVGLVRRNSLEIMLRKIESIHVIQSIPGRIFNYGVIIICGTGGSKDRFSYIPSPLAFRKMTQEQIDLQDRDNYDRKE